MHQKTATRCICGFALVLMTSLSVRSNDTLFPTPEILKGNVLFWKKIYSEVSLSEGLLHDRDYPMIIFEKVSGDASSAKIKQHKEKIVSSLNIIASQPKSSWTELENKIYQLYIQYADSNAIAGAADRVRFQQGQTERFQQGLQRSGLYLDTIIAIFKRYGVPQRLAYLPHVESSFNTEAYSKVGAAGLWQFMRGTGKLYGMKIDYTIDERRDPVIATTAAAKYLSSSYQELKSWPLAITSYNHGVYGIKRAVAQTGSRDLGYIIQNYSSRSFKFASSNFYGCFLAASELAQNHTVYFPQIKLNPPVKYTDFTLDNFIHPDILCRYMNISHKTFSDYNPAIRPVVFKQNKKLPKGLVVHLPAEITSESIYAMLSKIPDSLKATEPERPQYYRINKGDNLYTISSRLGVSINELLTENNISKKSIIHEGQILRIPEKAGSKPKVIATVATTEQYDKKANKISGPQIQSTTADSSESDAIVEIAKAEAQSSIPPEEKIEIKDVAIVIPQPVVTRTDVKKGTQNEKINKNPPSTAIEEISDSLKAVAMAPAIDNAEVNPTIRPSLSSDFDVSLYNLDVMLQSSGNSAELTVSIDETIGHYADWLKIPTWRIRKLNDMRHSDIRINSKIRIPVDRQDALETFAAARLEYHMAIEEDFYTQYMVIDVKPLVIKKGQTLWDLCNETDNPLPLWLFKKYNKHQDLGRLMPGTTVWIPVIGENTSGIYNPTFNRSNQSQQLTVPLRAKSQQIKRLP
ncbi:MAG TPA: transglycosylase SLT domain-containing protein [Chitinispirillaceae bacterium]|nr:transglycosylase SLT domain-containing protein [Chitinispirillaceae bacterium]